MFWGAFEKAKEKFCPNFLNFLGKKISHGFLSKKCLLTTLR
jgi:hypothetical protein